MYDWFLKVVRAPSWRDTNTRILEATKHGTTDRNEHCKNIYSSHELYKSKVSLSISLHTQVVYEDGPTSSSKVDPEAQQYVRRVSGWAILRAPRLKGNAPHVSWFAGLSHTSHERVVKVESLRTSRQQQTPTKRMLIRIGIFCGSAYVVGHDWRVIWRDQHPMDDAVPPIRVDLVSRRQDGLY